MEESGPYVSPPLGGELLIADAYQGKERIFGGVILGTLAHGLHPCVYGQTNWTQWVIFKKYMKLEVGIRGR